MYKLGKLLRPALAFLDRTAQISQPQLDDASDLRLRGVIPAHWNGWMSSCESLSSQLDRAGCYLLQLLPLPACRTFAIRTSAHGLLRNFFENIKK